MVPRVRQKLSAPLGEEGPSESAYTVDSRFFIWEGVYITRKANPKPVTEMAGALQWSLRQPSTEPQAPGGVGGAGGPAICDEILGDGEDALQAVPARELCDGKGGRPHPSNEPRLLARPHQPPPPPPPQKRKLKRKKTISIIAGVVFKQMKLS